MSQVPVATTIKTYNSRGAMKSGVKKMGKHGWIVQNTTSHLGKRGATKFLIGFLAKQKEVFTVTFARYQ